MHHNTRRLLPSTIIATAALTAAALAPTTASAQSAGAVSASATSNASAGMSYLGGSANNDVRIRLTGTTFTIDDVVPIQAGAGCAPVVGDPTKVTCTAFKDGTGTAAKYKRFLVNVGDGDDTVINQTNSGAQGAPMLAFGNPGHDKLTGGDGTNDTLRGGSQNDTLRGGNETSIGDGNQTVGQANDVLDGGAGDDTLLGGNGVDHLDGESGNDHLDGGPGNDIIEGGLGTHDMVTYSLRTMPVTVILPEDSDPPSEYNGVDNENDTITGGVEDATGGQADDILIGNASDNRLDSFIGITEEVLIGRRGADVLISSTGNDFLFSNAFHSGPEEDGAKDVLQASSGVDTCTLSVIDGDSASGCEH